jgi:LacI family transcriptional regulator
LELEGNFTEEAGVHAIERLLALSPRPTAIFACNDSMAIGALSALRDAGIQLPQEMALAGFDDVPIAPFLTPALTSVRVGINNLGIKAVDTLLHAVRHKNTHHKETTILETTLSLRESCGCINPQNQ